MAQPLPGHRGARRGTRPLLHGRSVVAPAWPITIALFLAAGAAACAPPSTAPIAANDSAAGVGSTPAAVGTATVKPKRTTVPKGEVPPPKEGIVTKLVDGDTIHVRFGSTDESLRLIGIDTPETKRPGTPIECFGVEASSHMKALLPLDTVVRVEFDVESRDRYDRLLGYVFRQSDNLFINRAMVDDGYAAPYRYPPNVAHADEFSESGRRAREDNKGLWGSCNGPHDTQAR